MSNLKQGNCRMCGNRAKLLGSHIMPKSIGKWLRDTSATGYLRMANNPNRRVQDLPTLPLFCFDCEQVMGKSEKAFKERIFLPIHYEFRKEFEYDEWLLRFAVSLALRTVSYFDHVNPENDEAAAAELRGACYRWRRYLLGIGATPGSRDHHMFIADPVTDDVDGLRRAMNSFLLRSVVVDILRHGERIVVLSKLPWFVFMSEVSGPQLDGWHNTVILPKGVVPTEQRVTDELFVSYVQDRAQYVAGQIGRISDRQQQVMARDALKNPKRTNESQTMDLHRLDRDLKAVEQLFRSGEPDW